MDCGSHSPKAIVEQRFTRKKLFDKEIGALRDNKDDARIIYQYEHYDTFVQMLRSELENDPTLETLQVEISTAHRIASSRAT